MATVLSDATSPDANSAALTHEPVDALRYDGQSDHPLEVAGMMQAMMPRNCNVLDVGCGTGSVTVIANRDKNNRVVAIEPDAQRAEIARSRGLQVHHGYLDDTFLQANGPYDVVMSSDVLEHTPNPAAFLGSMARAVKPGGLILLSVPNVAHWTVRLNLLIGRFDYAHAGIMDATHLRWFTAKTIANLVTHCGLTVMDMRHTAGVTLPVYSNRYFRRLPLGIRNYCIRALSRCFPLLFGVQHVIIARAGTP
ncbi:MAG TPA: class I SAM-dependent methyltransferase [Novosphingobium sp.]